MILVRQFLLKCHKHMFFSFMFCLHTHFRRTKLRIRNLEIIEILLFTLYNNTRALDIIDENIKLDDLAYLVLHKEV